MRAFRKRPWAELVVNMTPLIDVVFLIIIFFILLINFSELHIRNVKLPKADEARESQVDKRLKIPITIKTDGFIFLDRKRVPLEDLARALKEKRAVQHGLTIEIRADEDVPYETIKQVMIKMAQAQISKIEFSTYQEEPIPLDMEVRDESKLSI